MSDNSNLPDVDSAGREELRQRLYAVMENSELSLLEKQEEALSLGLEYLGAANGHIQRQDVDSERDTVIASVGSDPDMFPEGEVLERATTYCRRTAEERAPIALSNASEQGWGEDPAYLEHGFECYLGTNIFIRGEIYGTVCFISESSREKDFSLDEKGFIELLARLLGREIEANNYEQRLTQEEKERERSEDKYEALLQLAPDAIFLADPDSGKIVEANEKAVDISGYTECELLGRPVFDLYSDAHREKYIELFGSQMELEMARHEQFPDGEPLLLERADGSRIEVELSVASIELADKTLMQGIVRDISARRERTDALERSQEMLQQTQEMVGLGGWHVDLDTMALRWTDEVYRTFGLPLDADLSLQEAFEFYYFEDKQVVLDAFEKLTESGEEYDLELRVVTADGELRWVRTMGRPQYDANGEMVSVTGVCQDITARKAREKDLQLRSQVMEKLPIGVTIGDVREEDTPIIYANEGFTELTGYSKERVVGENCRFLQGRDTDDGTVAEIRAAIDNEEEIQTQILNYRANGAPFWNKLTISPVMAGDDGEVSHFVGIQEDVTAWNRRDRLIDVLNRVLRHNLRNSMGAITGFAGLIAAEGDGEVVEYAERIQRMSRELSALSEKAQEFQVGFDSVESYSRCDVVAEIRSVVTLLEGSFSEAEFRVEGVESASVMGTDQLRLVFRELGENAVKHVESSSAVFSVDVVDERVVVEVSDDGEGLPAAERRGLETGEETELKHGSGLGLWLVNWVVTSMGGEVDVSVEDGTTVTLQFPLASDEGGSGGQ